MKYRYTYQFELENRIIEVSFSYKPEVSRKEENIKAYEELAKKEGISIFEAKNYRVKKCTIGFSKTKWNTRADIEKFFEEKDYIDSYYFIDVMEGHYSAPKYSLITEEKEKLKKDLSEKYPSLTVKESNKIFVHYSVLIHLQNNLDDRYDP